MFAPGRKMTLLQRIVYEYLLESGFRPVDVLDMATELRIYPVSLTGILKRCESDGLGELYWEEYDTYVGVRKRKIFILNEEGAIELVSRLGLPRWPETKKNQRR